MELEITPEFQKSEGGSVKLKPEVLQAVLDSPVMTVEGDRKAPISAGNALLIMMDTVSEEIPRGNVENLLTHEVPVEWGFLKQYNAFTVWPKEHHNEAQFNAAVRWILDQLEGKPKDRSNLGLGTSIDLLDDIVGFEENGLLSIDNLTSYPDWDADPVHFPGDTVKFSVNEDGVLFDKIQAIVVDSNMLWAYYSGKFKLAPSSGMNATVFWAKVRELVNWYLEQIEDKGAGLGEPEVRQYSRGKSGDFWDVKNNVSIVGRLTSDLLQIDASSSTAIQPWKSWPEIKHVFKWMRHQVAKGKTVKVVRVDPAEVPIMKRLVDEGFVDEYEMQRGAKKPEDKEEERGPFTVNTFTISDGGSVPAETLGTFDTLSGATKVAEDWKENMESDADVDSGHFTWAIYNADGEEVAQE